MPGRKAFLLRESRRYAHAERYVRGVLAASGLSVASLATEVIRMDRSEPANGLIVVARQQRHPE